MNFIEKIVDGLTLDTAPSNTLQICYMEYVDRMCCGARMTKTYQLNMSKIRKLLDDAIRRLSQSNTKTSSIEHEAWVYGIFDCVLGKSAPYDSNNANNLTVYEWKLQSSVQEAFVFNKIRFDIVTVILENNMEHWFGIKTSSDYTYHRSRPRPRPRALMTAEFCDMPQSPIVLAANNPIHKSKCDKCGECNQIVRPMETYFFKKTCNNPGTSENELEPAEECTEVEKQKFKFTQLFK